MNFYVVDSNQKSILSGKVFEALNLVQRVHKIDVNLKELLDQHSVLQSAPGPTLFNFFFTIAYNTNITYLTRLISLTPLLTFLTVRPFLALRLLLTLQLHTTNTTDTDTAYTTDYGNLVLHCTLITITF